MSFPTFNSRTNLYIQLLFWLWRHGCHCMSAGSGRSVSKSLWDGDFWQRRLPELPFKNSIKYSELMGGCLSNSSGWVQLGRITLTGNNEWVTAAIEFTPQTNIACIGIGPDCTNHSYDPDFYHMSSVHFMDKVVLAPKVDFSFRTIAAISGNVCTGNFVLKAPPYANATYHWYKDGVLIPNANSEISSVADKPEAAGNYVVNIGQPFNTCLNSLPFAVNFSDLG